ncbi:uncharacterized protein [Anabrus simplex]|uniref:uncharacterized protein n=1 Tax=Anabrus simplex TaxID=316456 RepID=UPI0035A3101F
MAEITYNDVERSYVEDGENSSALYLSGRMKITDQQAAREKIIANTPVLEQQCAGLDLKGVCQKSTNRYVPPHLRQKAKAHVFPGRKKLGKSYKLNQLVKDELGEENSSDSATVDAINLEKLMNHAKVQPEMFHRHFFSLSDIEYWGELRMERLLRKEAKRAAIAGMTVNYDKKMSSMGSGEDSGSSLHSGSMKARNPKTNGKETSAVTSDVSRQEVAPKKMITKDDLQKNENPNGSHHFRDHTMVYLELKALSFGSRAELYQIGAHFAQNSFSRHVSPNGTFGNKATQQTELSKKDGILYLGGEQVETVSKMDAWKDFLKFLQSANNSVVLVSHLRLKGFYLLFRDLSELSLMDEFREICAGVIKTRPLCKCVFPKKKKLGKSYQLMQLVKDELGEENPSGNATVDAINLEKLMNHVKVQPEMFQRHFISLAKFENWCKEKRKRLLKKEAKRAAKVRMTLNDVNKTSSMENGEGSGPSLFSGMMKAKIPKDNRKETNAFTLDVNRQAKKMTTNDSLQNENPNGTDHFCDHAMVYINLKIRGSESWAKLYQVGAHFAEKSLSRHVSRTRIFWKMVAQQTKLSKKDCILYLGGEQVETVSKKDAWKDFLKFLQSANNSVILVSHHNLEDYYLLFRDLSEVSLMDEFREVCAGVIITLSLCKHVFPGRKKLGRGYTLNELVKDELGEENSSDNAAVDAINLEKLMNHAKVQPEMFRKHFFFLADLEYSDELRMERLMRKEAMGAAVAGMMNDDKKTSSMGSGEDSGSSLHSGSMKARNPKANRKETSAVTPDVSRQEGKMIAMDSLQNNENPKGSHFSDHTMVYFEFVATSSGKRSEVCEIGAHFGESSFSRYICPHRGFSSSAAKLTKKDGILYLEGERVETVSKEDAWKDFLKFLHTANNSVVLAMHDGQYGVLFRELSRLSLMEEFRKICAGVIDTLRLCRSIFPKRKEIGKNYKLKELVQDILGEENSSGYYKATADAVNLEKLMKHAKVEPEIFQQHFISISTLGCWYEDGRMKSAKAKCKRKETSAITLDISKQVSVNKMSTKDSHENPRGSRHFSEHTLVYFVLKATSSEVCQIGAYFAEKCFSKYVCPEEKIPKSVAKLTGLSKKDGILYLRGERVETVSKMDVWKDFLKFLQSANNSAVLVIHDIHNEYFLMFRDLSELLLMEEFRKVCAGVINTYPLSRNIFPGREKIGKDYVLQELVQDNLGKEISAGSHNAIVDAINLEKLMKHAKVQPEVFKQHFCYLFSLEHQYQIEREARLLKRKFPFMKNRAKKMAIAGITYNDLQRIYVEGGEDGISSFLFVKMKNALPKVIRNKAIAITVILSSELDL